MIYDQRHNILSKVTVKTGTINKYIFFLSVFIEESYKYIFQLLNHSVYMYRLYWSRRKKKYKHSVFLGSGWNYRPQRWQRNSRSSCKLQKSMYQNHSYQLGHTQKCYLLNPLTSFLPHFCGILFGFLLFLKGSQWFPRIPRRCRPNRLCCE